MKPVHHPPPSCKQITLSPQKYQAVIFDLDGVVTQTQDLHARAWKEMFDEFLRQHARQEKKPFQPFDIHTDYLTYVDGKPRFDGVESFLASRGIELSLGNPEDSPDQDTVYGLGKRKDRLFLERLEREGAQVYGTTVDLIYQIRDLGMRTAIISSSRNCRKILEATHLTTLFDAMVDGIESQKLGLQGKPAPDIFLEAARRIQVSPDRSVVIEDALSGVQAGKRGNFALVIGVDRGGHAQALRKNGADIVVQDLSEVGVESCPGGDPPV